jgi:uncharacterized membrane protein YqaE (UPF0057 family)
MKRILLSILAILFPWVVLLINDDPIGAIIALILQASIIGWIPASVWAWRIAKTLAPSKKSKKTSTE